MLSVDSIETGIVIDHIKPGKSMEIYKHLKLEEMNLSVAIIRNARSSLYGRKDIIKIEGRNDIDLDVLGFIHPNITVNLIEGGKVTKKTNLYLPETVKNVVKCKNPRCITSTEQGLDNIFKLYNPEKRVYRCIYCEQEC